MLIFSIFSFVQDIRIFPQYFVFLLYLHVYVLAFTVCSPCAIDGRDFFKEKLNFSEPDKKFYNTSSSELGIELDFRTSATTREDVLKVRFK